MKYQVKRNDGQGRLWGEVLEQSFFAYYVRLVAVQPLHFDCKLLKAPILCLQF